MVLTYTVHGHIKRRDGRQEALWTRTGLSKSQAQKLAKEQRSESGGVAKIVPEENRASPPRTHHATKKKLPAQLDREIAEALYPKRGRSLDDRPLADPGLISYRLRGPYGYIMIGARDHDDAMREAARSTRDPKRADLEIWDGDRYVKATLPRSPQRSHATMKPVTTAAAKSHAEQRDREIAPGLGKSRAQIVRAIKAIVQAADGRNVYLIRERLGENSVRRITRARTKGRGMDVYLLDSGRWLGVMPELGDRIDVR